MLNIRNTRINRISIKTVNSIEIMINIFDLKIIIKIIKSITQTNRSKEKDILKIDHQVQARSVREEVGDLKEADHQEEEIVVKKIIVDRIKFTFNKKDIKTIKERIKLLSKKENIMNQTKGIMMIEEIVIINIKRFKKIMKKKIILKKVDTLKIKNNIDKKK